jgi:signal transduction histidine kinase
VKGGSSIRRRLVLALAGVSLFTLLVVGAVFYLFLGDYVIDRQKELLLDQAVEVAEQVEGVSESFPAASGGVRGKGMINALLRADLRVLPAGSGIVVFAGSTVVARVGTAPIKGELIESLREQAEQLGGSEPASALLKTELGMAGRKVVAIIAAAPVELPDGVKGLAVVTLARADAFTYRSGILRTLLFSGGIAVALAVIMGWALGAWMTRPLRRLSVAARGIAGGSYEQPVTGAYPGEMQELADNLETMRQEVRRSEDSLRGFVSSAAHELRTPLTSIQGFSQALLDGTAATEEERSRSAAAIYRESSRLRRLVDALLTLSRYDSHEFRPNMAVVSVDGLVGEEADRLLQAGLVEPGRITTKVEGDARAVTDGDMLRQVIANLLHNAVQYGEGGPVEVRLRTSDRRLLLEVANGGQPLSTEEKSRLFSRFYRGRSGRQSEGFGLGLALVWEICDALGGKVELVEGGSLTRFRVTLPLSGRESARGKGDEQATPEA